MFKLLLFTISYFFISLSYSQESKLTKPLVINSQEKAIQLKEEQTVIENSVTKTYLVKNEEYYTKFIAALKGKKNHLKSDSILNSEAEKLNWYSKINVEIAKAEKELLKLAKK